MLFHALHLPTSWANAERVFKCNDAANKSLDVRAGQRLCCQTCPLNRELRGCLSRPTSSQPLAENAPHLVHKGFVLKIHIFNFGELFEQFALFFG